MEEHKEVEGGIDPIDFENRFNATLAAGAPQLYANGFVTVQGMGDIVTIFERNGQPVAVLNLSFTVAKTLAHSLGTVIATFEERTGRDMLTTHDVARLTSEPPQK